MPFKDFTIEEGSSSDINTYLMRQMMIVCTSGTRPSSPQNGMRIWETDTLKEMVYNGSTWLLLNENPIFVPKIVTESVTNSATVQDDDELFASVLANTDYVVTLVAFINGGSGFPDSDAWDAKVTFSGPTGATFGWSTQGGHPNFVVVGPSALAAPISVNYLSSISDIADVRTQGAWNVRLIVRGLLRVSSTAGTFRFRWSQSTATSGQSTRVQGRATLGLGSFYYSSYLKLERVA